MTSDGAALFRAICEQPWEDTPRLVYADWLEENGDPERAEFIRLQIEIAREPGEAQSGAMRARTKHLQKESHGRWTRGSPTGAGIRIGRDFQRGFYHEVTFTDARTFTTAASSVFGWAPIDTVTIGQITDATLARVLGSFYLSRVTQLTLGRECSDACCRALAECAHLSHLTELSVIGSWISDAGALALTRSPHLTRLQQFRLNSPRLTPTAQAVLKNRFELFRVH